MSHPFFIWTMQRTGGTSLTELLMDMSEHRKADHEPFNWRKSPRQFAAVAQNWAETKDEPTLVAALQEIFAQHYLIKHCYELHPELSFRLMQAAARADYRHIHLLRRDEMSRLISKFLSEANGTWFKDYSSKVYSEILEGMRKLNPLPVKKVVEQYEFCRDLTEEIRKFMRDLGVESREIHYEDLYVGDSAARLENLERLIEFLGFGPETISQHRSAIEDKIFHSGQNTASVVQFIPNLQQVVDALVAAGCPISESVVLPSELQRPLGQAGGPTRELRAGNVLPWQGQAREVAAWAFEEAPGLAAARQVAGGAVVQGAGVRAALAARSDQPPRGVRSVLPEFGAIAGWLTENEAEELFRAAATATSGCIVEVGSYRGRATQVLCAGSSVGMQLPVYAIDPHERSVGAFGTKFGPKDRGAFFRNFFKSELLDYVRLLNTNSSVVSPGWKKPVSLLYIAAAHRYPSVSADFAAWQPHLIPGATVAFYDAGLGHRQRAVEMLVASGTLDRVRTIGNLAVFHFTGQAQPLDPGKRDMVPSALRPIGAGAGQYQVPWDAIGCHVYYGGEGRYLYQPIPSSGCASVRPLLYELEGLVETDAGSDGEEQSKFPDASHLSAEKQRDLYEGRTNTFKFVIVQNPYTRLANVFRDKIRPDRAYFVKQIRRAAAEQGVALGEAIGFEEFVRVVSSQDIKDMDSHWRPQYYEGRFGSIKFDFVGRAERMPDDLIYVLERIGAPDWTIEKAGQTDTPNTDVAIWQDVSAGIHRMFLDRFAVDFDLLQYPRRLRHVV